METKKIQRPKWSLKYGVAARLAIALTGAVMTAITIHSPLWWWFRGQSDFIGIASIEMVLVMLGGALAQWFVGVIWRSMVGIAMTVLVFTVLSFTAGTIATSFAYNIQAAKDGMTASVIQSGKDTAVSAAQSVKDATGSFIDRFSR